MLQKKGWTRCAECLRTTKPRHMQFNAKHCPDNLISNVRNIWVVVTKYVSLSSVRASADYLFPINARSRCEAQDLLEPWYLTPQFGDCQQQAAHSLWHAIVIVANQVGKPISGWGGLCECDKCVPAFRALFFSCECISLLVARCAFLLMCHTDFNNRIREIMRSRCFLLLCVCVELVVCCRLKPFLVRGCDECIIIMRLLWCVHVYVSVNEYDK